LALAAVALIALSNAPNYYVPAKGLQGYSWSPRVIGRITVGGDPGGIAVDPKTGMVYVVNEYFGLMVVNGSSDALVANLSLIGARGIAVDPATNMVYVGVWGGSNGSASNSVFVIDGSTLRPVAIVPVGNSPYGIAVDPTTDMIYVTNENFDTVSVINGTLHKVIFNESTICNSQYADRWAITLGDITIIQPSNATLPFRGATNFSPAGEAISKIIFTVPDGAYDWNVSVGTGFGATSGTIDVNGSDVVVQMQAQPPGFCGGGLG
jgi:YVTN family beta-propeller protein